MSKQIVCDNCGKVVFLFYGYGNKTIIINDFLTGSTEKHFCDKECLIEFFSKEEKEK